MTPRERIVPFLRGTMWWARVPRLDGFAVQRSLGVVGKENRSVAVTVCDFLRWLRNRRESYLLEQLALGTTKVGAAYTAYTENRLDAFVVTLREGAKDVDLEPFVERWQAELVRRGTPNGSGRVKYLMQVRSMVHAGKPFPLSAFTKQAIRAWLESLTVKQPNRHRAALSSFAAFLVDEDVLTANPVLQIRAARESTPRTLHLSQGEAKRLLAHMEGVHQRFHAFLLATGMEYGAAVKVFRPSDFGGRSVLAQGTKTAHRARTCRITDTWVWAWEIATKGMPAQGAPFRSVNYYAMRAALKVALEKAKLSAEYTTHDHRHTWAVQAIRDGLPLHVVAHQLGHRDSVMTLRVYGRFVPNEGDYFKVTASATAPAEKAPSE